MAWVHCYPENVGTDFGMNVSYRAFSMLMPFMRVETLAQWLIKHDLLSVARNLQDLGNT